MERLYKIFDLEPVYFDDQKSVKELLEYADSRLSKCRFGENKPTCRRCPVHCYRPEMRRQMQDVMRYAGPRMFFHHPIIAIRHISRELRK